MTLHPRTYFWSYLLSSWLFELGCLSGGHPHHNTSRCTHVCMISLWDAYHYPLGRGNEPDFFRLEFFGASHPRVVVRDIPASGSLISWNIPPKNVSSLGCFVSPDPWKHCFWIIAIINFCVGKKFLHPWRADNLAYCNSVLLIQYYRRRRARARTTAWRHAMAN